MHWLPYRTAFNLLIKHEDTKSLHVIIRLTISDSRINSLDDTCCTTYNYPDNFLVGVLLPLNLDLRIDSCSTEPEVCS